MVVYPNRQFQPWQQALDFFESHLDQVGMPGFYVYLHTSAEESYRRRHVRELARGHNEEQFKAKFDRYNSMLGPQKAFFDALGQRLPGLVYSHEAAELEVTASCGLVHDPTTVETAKAFSFMRSWLDSHNPSDF